MKHQRGYTYKLKPTEDQEQKLLQFAGASRWVWNRALAIIEERYATTGKHLSAYEVARDLVSWKHAEETSWLCTINAQVLQQPFRDLGDAYTRFFKGQNDKPRFKKRGHHDHFRYPQGVKVEERRMYLPCIGWIRFFKSREIEGIIKSVSVKRKASGWYAVLKVEREVPEPAPARPGPRNAVGIDFGLRHFATLSDGTKLDCPKAYRAAESRLGKTRRSLSRKQRGSHNWERQRRRVALLEEAVANRRKDFLDKLSTELVERYNLICLEDLNLHALKSSLKLGKSISDASWGKFVHMLEYKAEERGKTVWKANRWWPSSKTCSGCGHVNKELKLKDTVLECPSCHLEIDRDLNAALNLVAAGLAETLNACGEDVRPRALRDAEADLCEAGTREQVLAPASQKLESPGFNHGEDVNSFAFLWPPEGTRSALGCLRSR